MPLSLTTTRKELVLTIALGASLFAVAGAAASANEPLPPTPDSKGTWSLVIENDSLAGTDRNYTNGFRAAWLSGTEKPEGLARRIARGWFGATDGAVVRHGFAIGHSIFTPDNTIASEPLPNQHPYAGWLYGEYNMLVQRRDTIDRLSIQAGVVGPAAGGEWVQNSFHSLIDVVEAQGWDNQMSNEAGIVLAWERKLRSRFRTQLRNLAFDVTPSVGITAGNVHTNVRAGVTGRLGNDLRNDFGPPRVRPSLAGAGFFNPRDGFGWYLFAGAEARAVAHNIFLEGSLFDRDDPGVDSKPLVVDFQAGGVLQFRSVQLSLTLVRRTDEFEQQESPQQFGALALQARF